MQRPVFHCYHGDGRVPSGCQPVTRDEAGRYLADDRLVTAVNTALAVEQPLLLTGEPGTGKTALAWSVASELGLGKVLEFHTRSDHQARDVLYTYDNLLRFFHAQTRDSQAERPERYVQLQALGQAIVSAERPVVLIDEIDKAPRDFPNDLLDEIDRMSFSVRETGQGFTARERPVVIITSNSERQLPDPFLRRCVFHHIKFPTPVRLKEILAERLGHLDLAARLIEVAVERFLDLRRVEGFEKLPATSELVVWARVLHLAGIDAERLARCALTDLPSVGALVKTRGDLDLLEKLRGPAE